MTDWHIPTRDELIAAIEARCAETGESVAAFGKRVGVRPLWYNLRDGHGVHLDTLHRIVACLAVPGKPTGRRGRPRDARNLKRQDAIIAKVRMGVSLRVVADQYGLTTQRISQIVAPHGGVAALRRSAAHG